MAISGKQFQQRDDQHGDIDYDIFAKPAFCFRCTHNHVSFPHRFSLACHVHEIDQGHDKYPHDIDKLPKEIAVFDVCGSVATALVAEPDDEQGNQRGDDVQEFYASNTEIGSAKYTRAPRVLREGHALINHSEPFANMQNCE